MKKNLVRCLICVLIATLLAFSACAFSACNGKDGAPVTVSYEVSKDGLLSNPDRGFRGEAYLTLGRNVAYPADNLDPYDELNEELARYPEDVKLVQQYVYLIDFYDKEISAAAFEQLTEYFEYLKFCGVRILLRFAYEYDAEVGKGPTTDRIVAHAAQIKTWIAENRSLFDDVVYATQLGMIGLWGEGHTSVNNIDTARVITAVADMIPEPYVIMVRYLWIYNEIPENLLYRFGIHEDWTVGKFDRYDYYGAASLLDETVESTINAAKVTVNDGEMPWGRTCGALDALSVLAQMKDYSMNTFSIAHSYIEDGQNNAYSLFRYKSEYLTAAQLEENGLPYLPELLNDGQISAFDYICYHLGYLVTLDGKTVSGGSTAFTFSNHGLASPALFKLQYKLADGTLVDADGDLSSLTQGGKATFTVNRTDVVGLRFVSKTNSSVTFRLASKLDYVDGVNVL